MPRVPDIPGLLAPKEHVGSLKAHVARLCGLERYRFPGSQPVSFGKKDMVRLENEDYWVCEKSDGVRLLIFVRHEANETEVYLIDRHDHYRLVSGYYFPFHEDPRRALGDSILDGELVIDVDPQTKQETLRLLVFDCLVINNENVMAKPLSSRYGRLKAFFIEPYERLMREFPHLRENRPFDIKIKQMELSYHVEKVLKEDIPRLQHGNDGLIYTCAESGYVVGTDERILKWKPPSENSIDFRLELRFPPRAGGPAEPDFCAKPQFVLNTWIGGGGGGDGGGKGKGRATYDFFDVMAVDDDDWERMKKSGEQVDDRVVEVCWDGRWRMLRFRDDKPEANHRSVAGNIVQSILDGIEQDELISRSGPVKAAWKARAGRPKPPAPPAAPPSSQAPAPRPRPPFLPPPPPAAAAAANNPGPLRPYGPLGPPTRTKTQGPEVWAGFQR